MKYLLAVVILSVVSIAEWFRRQKNMRDILAEDDRPICCIVDTPGASAFFDASRWLALEAQQGGEATSRVEGFHGEDGVHERELALQTRVSDWLESFNALGVRDNEDVPRLGITRSRVERIGRDLHQRTGSFSSGAGELAKLVKELTAPESHHGKHPFR